MTVMDEARRSVAAHKARESGQTLKEHVIDCTECAVDANGGFWLCEVGSALQQMERKARIG